MCCLLLCVAAPPKCWMSSVLCRSLPGAKVQQPETVQTRLHSPGDPSLQPMLLVHPTAACSTGWAGDTRMGGLTEGAWATAGGRTILTFTLATMPATSRPWLSEGLQLCWWRSAQQPAWGVSLCCCSVETTMSHLQPCHFSGAMLSQLRLLSKENAQQNLDLDWSLKSVSPAGSLSVPASSSRPLSGRRPSLPTPLPRAQRHIWPKGSRSVARLYLTGFTVRPRVAMWLPMPQQPWCCSSWATTSARLPQVRVCPATACSA